MKPRKTTLPIPQIPPELVSPIRSLTNAAYVLRGVFAQAAEGRPMQQILDEQQENLLLAEKVLDRWAAHLDQME